MVTSVKSLVHTQAELVGAAQSGASVNFGHVRFSFLKISTKARAPFFSCFELRNKEIRNCNVWFASVASNVDTALTIIAYFISLY